MQKRNSIVAGQSRNVGVRAVTMAEEPRSSGVTSILRAIYHSIRRWMAGRRDDIQIIAVQRGDFSIIS